MSRKPFSRATCALAMMLCLGTLHTQAHAQPAPVMLMLSIPAQPLGSALNELARQAGLQLMVRPENVQGRTSPALKGHYSIDQALERILAGTGLTADRHGSDVVIQPTAPGATAMLAPVRVQGHGGVETDGTSAYTSSQVTIGKGEQSVRDTPQSVSVVTRQRLDDQNLNTLGDAMRYTTGMKTTSYGTSLFNIEARGYDLDNYQMDGMPVRAGSGSWSATFLDLAMFDRVEVWRGPAGLIQGAGDPGGTVNLARKRALSEFTLQGTLSAGSWDNYRSEIDVSGPLSEDGRLRGRYVNVYEDRDYFTDYLWSRESMHYGTLEYDLDDSTTLSLAYAHQENKARPFFGLSSYLGYLADDLDRDTYLGADWNHMESRLDFYLAEVDHRMNNGGQAKLSASMMRRRLTNENNSWVNSLIDPATGNVSMVPIAIKADERDVNIDGFVSTPVQAFGLRHDLLLGASYQRFSGGSAYNASTYGQYEVTQDIYHPDPHFPKPYMPVGSIPDVVQTQASLYGQARLALSDPIRLILGARVSNWKTENHDAGTTQSYDAEVLPYLGLTGDLNDNWTAYASYSTIFSPQTARDIQGDFLRPRKGKQYEVGLNGAFFGDNLTTHFALYRIEDENRAMQDPDNPMVSIASGKVRSQGFEAEISGALTPNWQLTAGYAYTSTRYVAAEDDLEGKAFAPAFPRHTFSLWTKYTFDQPSLRGLSLAAGMRVNSESRLEQSGYTWVRPGYAVFDAQLGYRYNEHMDITFTVNNLFDKYYYERIGPTRQTYFGEPRSVMLALKWRM